MKLYNISKINNIDISELKTLDNGINTTIDNRVKTDLTNNYSNDDYENMTGLKNWVESKNITIDEIKDNLSYEGGITNFILSRNNVAVFNTKTNKMDINDVYTASDALQFAKTIISFYKNNNNKICGLCLMDIPALKKDSIIPDNSGNPMSMYLMFNHGDVEAATINFKIFNEADNQMNEIIMEHKRSRWNYMNIFFDEKDSESVIKALFGDNVSVNDIQCTNVNDYLRNTEHQYLDTDEEHPICNVQYSDPFLMNQTKSYLTNIYTNDDYESMTGLKNWVESKNITMDEIETNLNYNDENVNNFEILYKDNINGLNTYFNTRTNKLNLNEYYTSFPSKISNKFLISFYKNNNNKICGFCLFIVIRTESAGDTIVDNANNIMTLYIASGATTNVGTTFLKIYDKSNNEIQSSMSFNNEYSKWNFMNVFFDEAYSDIIIKTFFGDNVSVNDIQCTNINNYIRTSDAQYFDTTNSHPTYNLAYSNPFLYNQTKSYLTNCFTSSDFESMTNLKTWIQSLITAQINNQ